MRTRDPELRALGRITRLLTTLLPTLTPAGKRWLRDRLNAVELRDDR